MGWEQSIAWEIKGWGMAALQPKSFWVYPQARWFPPIARLDILWISSELWVMASGNLSRFRELPELTMLWQRAYRNMIDRQARLLVPLDRYSHHLIFYPFILAAIFYQKFESLSIFLLSKPGCSSEFSEVETADSQHIRIKVIILLAISAFLCLSAFIFLVKFSIERNRFMLSRQHSWRWIFSSFPEIVGETFILVLAVTLSLSPAFCKILVTVTIV